MLTITNQDAEIYSWVEKRLGQLGIDVRQSHHHIQIRYYLELLKEEIRMSEEFLKNDGAVSVNENDLLITRSLLAFNGFVPVESDMGPTYENHMEKGKLNLWEFNNTGVWLWNRHDSIGMRTMGDLKKLADWIGQEI